MINLNDLQNSFEKNPYSQVIIRTEPEINILILLSR